MKNKVWQVSVEVDSNGVARKYLIHRAGNKLIRVYYPDIITQSSMIRLHNVIAKNFHIYGVATHLYYKSNGNVSG